LQIYSLVHKYMINYRTTDRTTDGFSVFIGIRIGSTTQNTD